MTYANYSWMKWILLICKSLFTPQCIEANAIHVSFAIVTKGLIKKHDDVIKWKHFPRYWPFVRGIHRSPVNSPHKGQWRGALMFTLICARINGWVNTREAGDFRRYRAHYDVIVMRYDIPSNPRDYYLTISCRLYIWRYLEATYQISLAWYPEHLLLFLNPVPSSTTNSSCKTSSLWYNAGR